MPAIDDLAAVRRLLDVPGPGDDVTAAGRARLDELARREAAGPRRARHPARTAVACGLTAAAIAAVVVLARPGAAAHPAGSPDGTSAASQPAPAGSVQQAILTAVGSVGGDILAIRVTNSAVPAGAAPNLQYWLWPAKATPGQRVSLMMASGNGVQFRMTFTQVAGDENGNPQRVTGTAWILEPGSKTWTRHPGLPVPAIPERASLYLLDKNFLLRNFVHESKIVNSHTIVDGQAAIELTYPDTADGLRELLWVDAQTYLPLRLQKLTGLSGHPNSKQQDDYQFLPPTPANLEKFKLTS